jgi:hypothetical protein
VEGVAGRESRVEEVVKALWWSKSDVSESVPVGSKFQIRTFWLD